MRRFKLLSAAMSVALLGGCGFAHSMKNGAAGAVDSLFHKPVARLELNFHGRVAANTHATYMSALTVPTRVQVYQLRNGQALNRATYEALLRDAKRALGDDILDERTVVIQPGQGTALNVPIAKETQVVAIVAWVRQPDARAQSWRITLTREDLQPDSGRMIELADNRLTLLPLAGG